MFRQPPIAAILAPAAIGYMAFTGVIDALPRNVLAGLTLAQAGAMAAHFDDASQTIDCEQDPTTGQWVWASLAPRAVS